MYKRNKIISIIACVALSAAFLCSCKDNSENTPDANITNSITSDSVQDADSEKGLGDDSTSEQMKNETVEYIDVTVSESKYLYENKTIDLEELKKVITETKVKQVKITDENASQKAYSELKAFLDENDIECFDGDDSSKDSQ